MRSPASKLKFILTALALSLTLQAVHATVLSFRKERDGITCTLDKGVMKVKICLNNMVEVKYTTLPLLLEKPSLVITNEWKTVPDFSVTGNAGEIILTTASLKVSINRQNNAINYSDLKGNLILSEDGSQGKTMSEATVAGIPTYNCTSQFLSPAGEALYGLGLPSRTYGFAFHQLQRP